MAFGWAQALIDFIFWLHFIRTPYVITRFQPAIALLLVGVTTALGWIVGGLFAVLWNRLHRRP